MANLARGNRPSTLGMRREIEDMADEFDMPRRFFDEISRLFGQDLPHRTLWGEMDRLMDDFGTPPSLRRQMSRLFEQGGGAGRGMLGSGRETYVPAIDLTERDKEYLLRVDLPGIREQDIDVHVDADNVLTVQGERHEEETKNANGFEYFERIHGKFRRIIELPRGVETAKIETDFRNGVLEVRIPKNEARGPRRIPIGTSGAGREMAKGEEPRVIAPGGNGGRSGESRPQEGQGRGR